MSAYTNTRIRLAVIFSSMITAIFCVASPTLAQDATTSASAPADAQAPGTLQEVIVTAEKRAENVQSVPLAITAITGAQLQAANIENMTDLKVEIPSLTFFEYAAGQARYYIRGIGNNLDSGSVDEDVGVFVDGVYMGRPSMTNTDFMDLERVEVLRGPQGTLFGRNVVGGAISFTTRQPTADTRYAGDLSYGNYNEIDARALASGAISDNLFGSISLATSSHDGYGVNTTASTGATFNPTNATPGAVNVNRTAPQDVGDTQFNGVRATLRFVPSDSLDIQLHADGSRRRGSGTWAIIWRGGPLAGLGEFGEQSHPWSAAHYPDVGIGNVYNRGLSVDVNWQTSLGTFTSISAYRSVNYITRLDECVANIPDVLDPANVVGDLGNCYFEPTYTEYNYQLSQEFRLASPANQPFRWIVGAYGFYAHDYWSVVADWAFAFGFLSGQGAYGDPDQTSTTHSYALFGNMSYDLMSNLTVQAGVRLSRDEKSSAGSTFGNPFSGPWTNGGVPYPFGVGYVSSGQGTWDAVTPMATLDYQFIPDKYVYVLVSRGFKSGGFPTEQQDLQSENRPVAPEFAWNYEIGTKLEWQQRARLNLTAFYINYTNLQVNGLLVLGPGQGPQSVLLNAGKTSSKGVESEFDLIVTPNLSFNGSYTYTQTRINETTAAAAGVLPVGNELPNAPRNKAFVGATYRAPVTGTQNLIARADYEYQSSYASNLPNLEDERVPRSFRLNGGLTLQGPHWGFELWAKNLTNFVHPNFLTDVGGTVYAKPFDPPRTFGITVRYQN